MADQIQIKGSNEHGVVRNPLAIIGLSIITFGIYGIVWYFKANKELAAIGKAHGTEECGTSPGTSVLAITLGAFVIVPAFLSAYGFCKRLNAAERLSGAQQGMEPGLLFVLYVFLAPVAAYLAQTSLNRVLEAQAQVATIGGAEPLAGEPAPAAGVSAA